MEAGDGHIVEALDFVADELAAQGGLFRDWNIGGARAQHHYSAMSEGLRRFRNEHSDMSFGPVIERAQFAFDRARLIGGEPRDDQIHAGGGHTFTDGCDLIRALALPEYHLGNAAPKPAMIVELGKTQIFERQMAQAAEGFLGAQAPPFDELQDFVDFRFGHCWRAGSTRSARSRCSTSSRTARAS